MSQVSSHVQEEKQPDQALALRLWQEEALSLSVLLISQPPCLRRLQARSHCSQEARRILLRRCQMHLKKAIKSYIVVVYIINKKKSFVIFHCDCVITTKGCG